jgi:hypothetical protein
MTETAPLGPCEMAIIERVRGQSDVSSARR